MKLKRTSLLLRRILKTIRVEGRYLGIMSLIHELLLPDGVDVRRYPQFYILCLESYLFRQSGRIIYGLAECGLVVMFIGTECVWL